MRLLVISVFLATAIFDFVLMFVAYRSQGLPAPANLRDIYDSETYAKRSAYGKERLRLFMVEHICSSLVTLAILLSNFHSMLFYFARQFAPNAHLQALFMLGVVVLINQFVKTVFGAVFTFKIEAKYGFNNSTARTFAGDRAREFLIMRLGLYLGAIMLFLFLHAVLGNAVFVAFLFVFLLFEIALMFFGVFLAGGGKTTPLEDGELKRKIEALLARADFPIDKIYVRDDSKRHSKISASCAGFGKTRAVILGDNLLDGRYSDDEVLSVVAHEVEHSRAYQNLLIVLPRFAVWVALVFLARLVVGSGEISAAFGFAELNVAFGVCALLILYRPVDHLLSIPVNAMYRAHELAADRFGARMAGKEASISSLKKGARDNFENLTPHWLSVIVNATHPPMTERIAAVERSV